MGFKGDVDLNHHAFNMHGSRGRGIVEMAYGMLKVGVHIRGSVHARPHARASTRVSVLFPYVIYTLRFHF